MIIEPTKVNQWNNDFYNNLYKSKKENKLKYIIYNFYSNINLDSLNIMVEIASLMGNPEYTEKAELNELLNWYFEKTKQMKIKKA